MYVVSGIVAVVSGLYWFVTLMRLMAVASSPTGGLAAVVLEVELGVSFTLFMVAVSSTTILSRLSNLNEQVKNLRQDIATGRVFEPGTAPSRVPAPDEKWANPRYAPGPTATPIRDPAPEIGSRIEPKL